jgi:hypothetical protein
MISFEEISFRDGIPSYLRVHIKILFEGRCRKHGKHIITEHFLTEIDRETIKRLIEYTKISEWKKLEKILPESAEQIRFFDAAWMTAINYNQFRYRRGQAGETLKEELCDKREKIQTTVQYLRRLIAEHNQLVGGSAFRAHIGTPELEEALKCLLLEIDNYDNSQVHAESFVCAALKSREKSPREGVNNSV